MAEKKINLIIAAKDMATATIGKIRKGFEGLKSGVSSVFSPGGMIAGGIGALGVGALGKSFLDTASRFEDLETSLTTVTGSLKGAKDAMAFVNQEAKASPFTRPPSL